MKVRHCPPLHIIECYFAQLPLADTWKHHIETCSECQSALEDIQTEKRRLLQRLPAQEFVTHLEQRKPRWYASLFLNPLRGVLAGAIAALLVILFVPSLLEKGEKSVRLKGGGVAVAVVHKRGATQHEIEGETKQVKPGDQLRLVVTTPSKIYLQTFALDAHGASFVYYTNRLIEPGEQEMSGSIVLDESPLVEKLFIVACAQPLDIKVIVESVSRQLSQIKDLNQVNLETTCGYQRTIMLTK